MTSRERNALTEVHCDAIMEMETLSPSASAELFMYHAETQHRVPVNVGSAMIAEAIGICGGLPLSLKVRLTNREPASHEAASCGREQWLVLLWVFDAKITHAHEPSCTPVGDCNPMQSQVFRAMVAGEQKAFWEDAMFEMRNAGYLEAGGTNLLAQLRIPYDRVPPQAQVQHSTLSTSRLLYHCEPATTKQTRPNTAFRWCLKGDDCPEYLLTGPSVARLWRLGFMSTWGGMVRGAVSLIKALCAVMVPIHKQRCRSPCRHSPHRGPKYHRLHRSHLGM